MGAATRPLALMVARRRGRVLNVASTATFQSCPWMAVYCATKAYVLSFSLALGEELRGTGVTVTALCPGPTETGFMKSAGVEQIALFNTPGMAMMTPAAVARGLWWRAAAGGAPGADGGTIGRARACLSPACRV